LFTPKEIQTLNLMGPPQRLRRPSVEDIRTTIFSSN
jgi:hypothetical protein